MLNRLQQLKIVIFEYFDQFWQIFIFFEIFDRNTENLSTHVVFSFKLRQLAQMKLTQMQRAQRPRIFNILTEFSVIEAENTKYWNYQICQILDIFVFKNFFNMETRPKYEKRRPLFSSDAFDLHFDI